MELRQVCLQKQGRLYEMLLHLAERLGIAVIAEGVETEEQYLWLKYRGVKQFQGYLFFPVLEPEMFIKKQVPIIFSLVCRMSNKEGENG
ncbi:TPA: EAL domain-containing protein [Salmonella enterica subsp. enterica serovar Freetown]